MSQYTDLIARLRAYLTCPEHGPACGGHNCCCIDRHGGSTVSHDKAIREAADALEALQAEADTMAQIINVKQAQVEALQAERDAIDALHQPRHGLATIVCVVCARPWPCYTHRILHPGEPTT